MNILSPWKITWDKGGGNEVVVVAIDDRLAEIFNLPSRQRLDERRPIGATSRDHLARNHWETRLTFRHYKTHASITALCAWKASHLLALQAVGNADLILEYDDGAAGLDALKIPEAALESVDPRQDTTDPLRTITTYTFKGGALVAVP